MGVELNFYVLYGARFPYEDLSGEEMREKLEPYMDSAFDGIKHKDGLCVLFDGMNGEYVFIGRVLAKTPTEEQGMGDLDEPVLLEIPDVNERNLMRGLIGALTGADNANLGLWFVPHFR